MKLEDYTEQQIRELPAGRELDGLVSEVVGIPPYAYDSIYSEGWASLLVIARDWCSRRGARLEHFSKSKNGLCYCDIIFDEDDDGDYEPAPTLAIAICRALCLAAKRWGESKEQDDDNV